MLRLLHKQDVKIREIQSSTLEQRYDSILNSISDHDAFDDHDNASSNGMDVFVDLHIGMDIEVDSLTRVDLIEDEIKS